MRKKRKIPTTSLSCRLLLFKCSYHRYLIQLFQLKADFHSVQNVARSNFCDRFLLKCVQSTTANEFVPLECLYFKRKRSQKVDRTTFCTEWKSALRLSPEQSGKVEYERERLMGIANKCIHILTIPSSLSRSYSTFPLCSGDNLN
jgi:hypothetical protein